jgi:hypothetical protein
MHFDRKDRGHRMRPFGLVEAWQLRSKTDRPNHNNRRLVPDPEITVLISQLKLLVPCSNVLRRL